MPSARRLLTIGGATFVGLAATALFAAPASAHTADTKASACKTTTGSWLVTWKVSNDHRSVLQLTDLATEPGAIDGIKNNAKGGPPEVPGHGSITGKQELDENGIAKAELSFAPVWTDKYDPGTTVHVKPTLKGDCTPGHKPPGCKPGKPGKPGDGGDKGKPCEPAPCTPGTGGDKPGKPGDGHGKPCEPCTPGTGGDKPGEPGNGGDKGKPGKPCEPAPCTPGTGTGGDKPGEPGTGGDKPGEPGKGGDHGKPCEPTTPGGGTGGGDASPTPSPSKPAPPSLPLTGSQAAIYGGGSAVLLGAGGGLFFAARRRRVTFQA